MKVVNLYNRFRNLILYGIIGAMCAALDFGIYSCLCLVIPFLLANIISTHVGIICSFLLNRYYNFKVKDKTPQRFVSFYLVGLLGLGLSEVLLYLFVDIFDWSNLLSKLFTIFIVALLQFLLNKYVTFKK